MYVYIHTYIYIFKKITGGSTSHGLRVNSFRDQQCWSLIAYLVFELLSLVILPCRCFNYCSGGPGSCCGCCCCGCHPTNPSKTWRWVARVILFILLAGAGALAYFSTDTAKNFNDGISSIGQSFEFTSQWISDVGLNAGVFLVILSLVHVLVHVTGGFFLLTIIFLFLFFYKLWFRKDLVLAETGKVNASAITLGDALQSLPSPFKDNAEVNLSLLFPPLPPFSCCLLLSFVYIFSHTSLFILRYISKKKKKVRHGSFAFFLFCFPSSYSHSFPCCVSFISTPPP